MNYPAISKSLTGRLSRLHLKKIRDEKNVFIAEGSKCVEDTLGHFELLYLIATPRWFENHNITPTGEIFSAGKAELERISSLSTAPDVIAVYRKPSWIMNHAEINASLTLLLDDVQDPGNLGTIVRLADWFGVKNIIASPGSADIFNPKTVMATMGSISRVKVFYRSLPEFVTDFSKLPVIGLLLDGNNIYSACLPSTGFIVMGNEGRGLSPQMRDIVTMKLLIPSFPPGEPTGESLNVAMATSITLSEFRRRQF